jgi:hypothetical protein
VRKVFFQPIPEFLPKGFIHFAEIEVHQNLPAKRPVAIAKLRVARIARATGLGPRRLSGWTKYLGAPDSKPQRRVHSFI